MGWFLLIFTSNELVTWCCFFYFVCVGALRSSNHFFSHGRAFFCLPVSNSNCTKQRLKCISQRGYGESCSGDVQKKPVLNGHSQKTENWFLKMQVKVISECNTFDLH